MALDSINSAGGNNGARPVQRNAASASPSADSPSRSARSAPAAPDHDAVDLQDYAAMARAMRASSEKLAKAAESRRKLLDALREVMNSGGLDTPEAAQAAADGILRTAR